MHKFFKVVLDPKADSLKIPPEFVKRYGKNLPNPVLLKVPTGSMMVVELAPSDGKTLMLQKGWKEFRERYKIGFGHLLVFEYNGKSEFNVAIFDKTAVEINYADYKTEDRRKVKAENQDGECGDTGTGRQFSTGLEMQRAVMKKNTSMAYQKAAAFASAYIDPKKNPFHIGLMQHSYVSHGFCLKVPFSFIKQSLPCAGGANSISISMVMDGKRWSVRCLVKDRRAYLSSGWKRFALDNGIKKGDVCIFEVAERTKPTLWNVAVFRS